jgi:hypothetical protein
MQRSQLCIICEQRRRKDPFSAVMTKRVIENGPAIKRQFKRGCIKTLVVIHYLGGKTTKLAA